MCFPPAFVDQKFRGVNQWLNPHQTVYPQVSPLIISTICLENHGNIWEYIGKLYPHFPHGPLVVQSHDSHDLPQKASVHLFQKASSRSRRSSSGSFMRLVVFLRASGAVFFRWDKCWNRFGK